MSGGTGMETRCTVHILYKALNRSRLDYGSAAYDSAAKTRLQALDMGGGG